MTSMPRYKKSFIDLISARGLTTGNFKLSEGRPSTYYFHAGEMCRGDDSMWLGQFYATMLNVAGIAQDDDILYGIREKGVPIAITASIALFQSTESPRTYYSYRRAEEKHHGNASKSRASQLLVGREISDSSRVILIDDVITTGDSKYSEVSFVRSFGKNIEIPALVIAIDRQEVNDQGLDASKEFTRRTGIPVFPIVTSTEIYDYRLNEIHNVSEEEVRRFIDHLKKYGTQEAKEQVSVKFKL